MGGCYVVMLLCHKCREDSSKMLKNAKDGTFLVRPTKNTKVPHHVYTVDIKWACKKYNSWVYFFTHISRHQACEGASDQWEVWCCWTVQVWFTEGYDSTLLKASNSQRVPSGYTKISYKTQFTLTIMHHTISYNFIMCKILVV